MSAAHALPTAMAKAAAKAARRRKLFIVLSCFMVDDIAGLAEPGRIEAAEQKMPERRPDGAGSERPTHRLGPTREQRMLLQRPSQGICDGARLLLGCG